MSSEVVVASMTLLGTQVPVLPVLHSVLITLAGLVAMTFWVVDEADD